MQERTVTADGTSHALPRAFTVFATQNPIEFEGTYPLPEAELDRFLLKVTFDYPTADVETGILKRYLEGFEADAPETYGVDKVATEEGLVALQARARAIRVEPALLEYITAIVRGTRAHPSVTLGASPRASVALLKASRANAVLERREFVVPDDVKAMAKSVLRHRITVAPELELEGVTPDATLAAILERVAAPAA
jgi:MoxR-like ATPase